MRRWRTAPVAGWLGMLCGLSLILAGCTTGAPAGLRSAPDPGTGEVAAGPPEESGAPGDAQATAEPRATAAPAPTEPPPPPPAATAAPPTATATPAEPPPPPTATVAPPPTVASAGGRAVLAEYGTSGRREIALTFDAGADRGYAAEILDLLQAEGITASFGLLGQWAEQNPDLVLRMVNEGHMMFNHSWTHRSLTGASSGDVPQTYDEVLAELSQTEQVVAEITGGYDLRPYFRPPYGDYDLTSLEYLARAGYPVALMWSCDSRDSLGATAAEILASCIDTAQPGRIVLLHVGAQSAAYEALPQMISTLRANGFTFVTAEQILQP